MTWRALLAFTRHARGRRTTGVDRPRDWRDVPGIPLCFTDDEAARLVAVRDDVAAGRRTEAPGIPWTAQSQSPGDALYDMRLHFWRAYAHNWFNPGAPGGLFP